MSKVIAKLLGEKFTMMENYGMVTIPNTGSLVTSKTIKLERNPAAVFLASKVNYTRKDYQSDLNTIARLLGAKDAFSCNWAALRYHHTQAIRIMLQEIISERTGKPLSPATINHMLNTLRGVLKTAWKLGLMSGDDYQRAVDIEGVKGETLPAGRELSRGEIRL
jgi:integrase/recombinase XerD